MAVVAASALVGIELVVAVTVKVHRHELAGLEREDIVKLLSREGIEQEILWLDINYGVVDYLSCDPHGHGDPSVVRLHNRLPAVVHVPVRRHRRPVSVAVVVEGDNPRLPLLLVVLADRVDEPPSVLVLERHNHIRMSQIPALVRTEQLVSIIQTYQPLSPEKLVHPVVVEVKDRAEMACTCPLVICRDQDVPPFDQLPVLEVVALKVHVAVGPLRAHQNRCPVGIAARDVEAVGVGHAVIDRVVGPLPLSCRLSGEGIHPLQEPCVQAERKARVKVVQEPDLIHPVLVQIEGDERHVPDTGDLTRAQVPHPEPLAALGVQSHLEGVSRVLEQLRPWVDVPLG